MHYYTKTEYTCAQSNIILPTRSWPLVLRGQRLVHMLLKEVLNSCRDTNSSRKTCQNAPINTQADWWRTTSWALLESALKKDTVRRLVTNRIPSEINSRLKYVWNGWRPSRKTPVRVQSVAQSVPQLVQQMTRFTSLAYFCPSKRLWVSAKWRKLYLNCSDTNLAENWQSSLLSFHMEAVWSPRSSTKCQTVQLWESLFSHCKWVLHIKTQLSAWQKGTSEHGHRVHAADVSSFSLSTADGWRWQRKASPTCSAFTMH